MTTDDAPHLDLDPDGLAVRREVLGPAHVDAAITLTALVAHGHLGELELHLRGALRNGLSREEIVEVLLQCAIYSGVPAANAAFGVARRVLAEEDPQD